jgi:hypothetical protein
MASSTASPSPATVTGCDPSFNKEFGFKELKAAFDGLGPGAWRRQLEEDPDLWRLNPSLVALKNRVFVYALLTTGRIEDGVTFSFLPSREEARWTDWQRRDAPTHSTRIIRLTAVDDVKSSAVTGTATAAVERYRKQFLGWSSKDRATACDGSRCRHIIYQVGSGWSTEFRVTCLNATDGWLTQPVYSYLMPGAVARLLGQSSAWTAYDSNAPAVSDDTKNDKIIASLLKSSALSAETVAGKVPWTTESQARALLPFVRRTYSMHTVSDVPLVGTPTSPEVLAVSKATLASGAPLRTDYVSGSWGPTLPPPPAYWVAPPAPPAPAPAAVATPPAPAPAPAPAPTTPAPVPGSYAASIARGEAFISGTPGAGAVAVVGAPVTTAEAERYRVLSSAYGGGAGMGPAMGYGYGSGYGAGYGGGYAGYGGMGAGYGAGYYGAGAGYGSRSSPSRLYY